MFPLFLFIFFRREKGNCKICWIPISASADFQVSGKLFLPEILFLNCRLESEKKPGNENTNRGKIRGL
jgi:hypothetical protein